MDEINKLTCRYSFEVLKFHCNDFGFTFNIAVSYLGIFYKRHQWFRLITLHCFFQESFKNLFCIVYIFQSCVNVSS